METVVGVESIVKEKIEESAADGSVTVSSTKQLADPVVYKLVRVEGDGRLVPATDDEVMEVEDFLKDDHIELCAVSDAGNTEECIPHEGSFFGKPKSESSKDDCEHLHHKYVPGTAESENLGTDASILQEVRQPASPGSGDRQIDVRKCLSPKEELKETDVCHSSKPDFSLLKGEICLNDLSIRQLQELFIATFGRETTVKDKSWLKRRIAMGLSNSCYISDSGFVIKDGKLVNTDKEKSIANVDILCVNNPEFGLANAKRTVSMPANSCEEDHEDISVKRCRNGSPDLGYTSKDQIDDRDAKRIRKPTKRYIEELSDFESRDFSPRSSSLCRSARVEKASPKYFQHGTKSTSSDVRTVVTRLDSLGGTGIYVPFVSRVRRSRPRKNVMALLKFNSSGLCPASQLVENTFDVQVSQVTSENTAKLLNSESVAESVQHSHFFQLGKDDQSTIKDPVEVVKHSKPRLVDSSVETSDGNVVAAVRGGEKGKHHRAWTLVEVVKLVEGVSEYGAGRWSAIKRHAFASDAYRSPVDLKDKWRNLLRASFAQSLPSEKMSSRKHASVIIPAHILLRVKELSEMHGYSISKLRGGSEKTADEMRSGSM